MSEILFASNAQNSFTTNENVFVRNPQKQQESADQGTSHDVACKGIYVFILLEIYLEF